MALHWVREPRAALAEFHRVLAPEGLLMFSTLGPDTLKELRAAAGEGRVHSFADMHDLGDRLVAAGFAAPVMDMETLTLAYRDVPALLADLRASGQTNARADRPRGLARQGLRAALRARWHPRHLRSGLRPRVEGRAAQERRRTQHRAVRKAIPLIQCRGFSSDFRCLRATHLC